MLMSSGIMSVFLFCLDDYSNTSLRYTRPNIVTFKKAVIFTATAMRTSNSRFCKDIMLVLGFFVIKQLHWRNWSQIWGLAEQCNAVLCAFPLEACFGSGFAAENWDCTVLFIRYCLNFYQRLPVFKIADWWRIGYSGFWKYVHLDVGLRCL
jgi:hypothetical protein